MSARIAITLMVETLVFAVLLFSGAGRLIWLEGWLFLALFAGGSAALCVWLAQHDPALLEERTGIVWGSKGQPLWDRIFMGVMALLFLAWLVAMGVGARLGRLPRVIEAAGLVLTFVSFWGLFAVFRANTFLAPVVKLQPERGQRVIDTGPYAVVRHPMYAFASLWILATPLLLGSPLGLVASAVLVAAVTLRVSPEERELRRGLPGYGAYCARVRWRLVPGLW